MSSASFSLILNPTFYYNLTTMGLPAGFPEQLKGPMAWDTSDFGQNAETYTLTLTESDLLAIGKAVSHFKGKLISPPGFSSATDSCPLGLGLPRGSINRSNFPLPEDLTTRLRQINDTLNSGRGFQVVRGIDPTSYSEEDHILIFAGICAHVATHRNWFIGMFIKAAKHQGNISDKNLKIISAMKDRTMWLASTCAPRSCQSPWYEST